MLFYNQIKRQFSAAAWRRGQIYFREQRVKNVRLERDLVVAQVQGTDEAAYETALVIGRGTLVNSKCSCPAHRLYETHCKHVAALGIWVVERGSLLRAGVGGADFGLAEIDRPLVLKDPEKAAADVRLRKLIQVHPQLRNSEFIVRRDKLAGFVEGRDPEGRGFTIPVTSVEVIAFQEHAAPKEEAAEDLVFMDAEPVTFVRGFFQNQVLSAISLEPAVRYEDPESHILQVQTLNYLSRQPDTSVWKTPQGVLLKLIRNDIPILENIDSAKIIYQGQAALENLAKLLMSEYRKRIVFHQAIDMQLDSRPLRLVSLNIGKKGDKSRSLTYKFQNEEVSLTSEELDELARQGRVSDQYVWKDNRIFKLGVSLTKLAQYANRSGIAATDGTEAVISSATSGQLYDHGDHPLHPLAAYRLSLELGVDQFNVDQDWEEFHEWKKIFEKKKLPTLPKVDYGFDLREYQTNGLSWMWSLYHRGLSALLADDMGLGKTHQVLAFLTSLYSGKGKPKEPTLVVAPTSVVAAWIQKLRKYDTHLKWHVFHGKSRVIPKAPVDLVLTTYGILQREGALRDMKWHCVVLDEAQAIKNPSTLSSRCARALQSKFRISMTGTPVENQATDLWSLLEFLLPGYLGSLPRFKRLYGAGRDGTSQTQAEALKRLVSPFLLRRTKSQVLTELPEKTEEVVSCEMTEAQEKAYRAYLRSDEAKKVRENLEGKGKVDYASILALLTRLKQVCDHPRLPELTTGKVKKAKSLDPTETGKWETFEEILNEALGSGLKMVVFTQYLGMMDLIGEFLTERGIGFTDLRGDTPDRAKRLDIFANDPDCKVFVCSLLAGGLGIDLTSASVCVHFDRWWNPAKENQATDRLHRIGQTRGVQIFKLQIPGTVEDRIAHIIQSKVALSGALIDESPLGLKAFSRKELLELLAT